MQDRETNLFHIGQYVICRCYCALDDQVTADALERFESIEEKELRSGHLWSLIFGDHDRAQVSHTDMCWQPLSWHCDRTSLDAWLQQETGLTETGMNRSAS